MNDKKEPLPESDLGSERFWKSQGTVDLDAPSAVESDNPEEAEPEEDQEEA